MKAEKRVWRSAPFRDEAQRVGDALFAFGQATRTQLRTLAHLTAEDAEAGITQLREHGLLTIVEGQRSPVTGVAEPDLVLLTREAGLVVGAEIGRTHITVVIATAGHEEFAKATVSLSEDAENQPVKVLQQTADLIEEILGKNGARLDMVIGIGLGIPAPVTLEGRFGSTTFLNRWIRELEHTAGEELSRRLGGVCTYLDNDGSLGALGEYMVGAGQGSEVLLYVKAATGIGAGIVIGGKLYRGVTGTAAELGHVSVNNRGDRCTCGNRGCLELYAGGKALLEEAKRTSPDIASVADLVNRAKEGNSFCRRSISEAGEHLGAGLGSVVNILNPDRIVVGGALSEADQLLLDPIQGELRISAMPAAVDRLSVVSTQLGGWASAWGGVARVWRSEELASASTIG
ncbi:MAG TPA: ROK family protein [Streptosporangiaceae bacterium]|nr:ROK family protein [Streptosporangiaceae bacterium]